MPAIAQPLTPSTFRYLDVNTNYSVGSMQLLVAEIQAINNQLFNLFQTFIGEADLEPEFGTTIPSRLFDLLPGTKILLETDAYLAVNRWMGDRIIVNPGDIRAIENYEDRAYDVYIKYFYPVMNVSVDYGVRLYTSQSKIQEQ